MNTDFSKNKHLVQNLSYTISSSSDTFSWSGIRIPIYVLKEPFKDALIINHYMAKQVVRLIRWLKLPGYILDAFGSR